MGSCKILNKTNGKESGLYNKLYEVLGTKQLAKQAYASVMSEGFQEDFGNWVDNYEYAFFDSTMAMRQDDNGEPKLFRKEDTDQWYFEGISERIFLNKVKFAEFTEETVEEVTNQLMSELLSGKGKNLSFNHIDEDNLPTMGMIFKSIDESMDRYIFTLDTAYAEGSISLAKRDDMVANAEMVQAYKEEFASEMADKIQSYGFKLRANKSLAANEENVDNTPDGKDPNFSKDSFESNSKDAATTNTKLFLSQILALEYVDGKITKKKGNFLNMEMFADYEDVWSTLEPALSDIVSIGHGDNVSDVFSQMITKMEELEDIKPWVVSVIEKLKDASDSKKTEFVQAFSKTKLNFLITEVNGKKYKVINASVVGSRDYKLRNDWAWEFGNKWNSVGGTATEQAAIGLNELKEQLTQANREFGEAYNNAEQGQERDDILDDREDALAEILKRLGTNVVPQDITDYVNLNTAKNKEPYDVLNELSQAIGFAIDDLLAPGGFGTVNEKRNPFSDQKTLRALSKSMALGMVNFAENTVILNGGKMGWGFSSPSYLSNKVNQWKNDPSELEKLSTLTYNKNSQWISYLLATGKDVKKKDRERVSAERLDKLSLVLAASFKSKGKSDGVDNKKQTKPDAINESIVKMLGGKIGNESYMPTIVPADKSRRTEIGGLPFFDAGIVQAEKGLRIPNKTLDVFVNYFEDEYNRMIEVWNEIDTLDDSKKIQHYHTGNMNGTRSQLFPNLSHDSNMMTKAGDVFGLRSALYKENGRPLSTNVGGLTSEQKKAIREYIKIVIYNRMKDSKTAIESVSNLDTDILDRYESQSSEPLTAMAGDHAVNGLIATIEYGKMFSGDPAYYKDMPDMIKRIPATYSDGQQLRLKNSDNLYFKQATISNVEVASEYLQEIIDSVDDPKIAEAYKKVNTTDAQGWITPNRWKFLQEKLGKWTPLHDKAYANMMAGKTLTKRELKLAAQPLKGVYFEINDGRPVYLKYSQAVIIPSMVKGLPMEKLLDKMTKDKDGKTLDAKDEIGEVVTADGVKVGAVAPTTINKEGKTEMLEDFELNPTILTNRGWKLQQDLPTKLTKDAAVGSQIQKNILSNLSLNEKVYTFNGKEKMTGGEVLQEIHDTVSKLSDIGRSNLEKEFGIVNGKITNPERIYSALIEEFRGKEGGENIISALEKETPLDDIPQVRQQVQSMFMSMMNKEMTKIKTNGASFIQVSNFGLDRDVTDKSGIKILSKNYDPVRGLKPPRKENGVVKPGQVFIPYSALKTMLKGLDGKLDFDNMTSEELMAMIDPSALEMITYRIPNQGMSSNDAVEIVGILPDSMGDAIIGYDAIPGKTGSDFDIDKMFVMMHNLELRNGKVQKISPNQSSKAAIQNRLVELYWSVLTSPATYDDMMRSIDSNYLKDDINGLFPPPQYDDLQIFSPTSQIDIKFDYVSGKAGVGQTANMLVDHVLNQSLNIRLDTYIGIGNISEDGVTKFDEIMDKDGTRSIADSLSAFLNAYVDIAKDPYVSRGNHNSVTANMTFMLLRAGVSVEWVNRFMGQPILIDLVKEMEKMEGITSERVRDKSGKTLDAFEVVRQKYGVKIFNASLNDSKAADLKSKDFLERQIKAEPGTAAAQDMVLNVFEGLMTYSKAFSASVIAAKSDTKGGGTSFAERLIIQNRKEQVLASGTILGYQEKFNNTMNGTYHENAVDFVGEVLNNSALSISATRALENTFNSISNRMGRGERITSIDLAKDLDSSYYSYAMSGTEFLSVNTTNIPGLFTKLGDQVMNMKKKGEPYSKNFLIKEIIVNKDGQYNFMTIDASNKPAVYKNKIYRSWNELYRNPETKPFAKNLVRYAYSATGFKSGLGQFFAHIPHEILKAEGVGKDFKKIAFQTRDADMDSNFREQYFRHNWENAKVVPRVSFGVTEALPGGIPKTVAFHYKTDLTNDALSTGQNIDGLKTYPEFVTIIDEVKDDQGFPVFNPESNEILMNEVFYKYVGNELVTIKNKSNEDIAVYRPLYVRTHKLGKRSRKGNVVEWNYGTKTENSQIPSNNIPANMNKMINGILDKAMANPELIPAVLTMDNTTTGREVELSEGETIVNKEDVKAYRDYLRKTGEIPSTFFTSSSKFSAFYNNETGKREGMPQSVAWNINNVNNLYDAINNESGEVFIESVDLNTGIQYIAKGNIDAISNNIDEIANDNDITCNG